MPTRYTCIRGGGAGGGIQRTASCSNKCDRVNTGAPRDVLAWAKRHARFCNHYKTIFDVIRVELEQPPVYGHSQPRSNYGWHDAHRGTPRARYWPACPSTRARQHCPSIKNNCSSIKSDDRSRASSHNKRRFSRIKSYRSGGNWDDCCFDPPPPTALGNTKVPMGTGGTSANTSASILNLLLSYPLLS